MHLTITVVQQGFLDVIIGGYDFEFKFVHVRDDSVYEPYEVIWLSLWNTWKGLTNCLPLHNIHYDSHTTGIYPEPNVK